MSEKSIELEERKAGKDLYSYQKEAINKIFKSFEEFKKLNKNKTTNGYGLIRIDKEIIVFN